VSPAEVNAGVDNRRAFKGLWADSGSLSTPSWKTKVAAIFLLAAAIQLAAGWLLLFRPDVHVFDYDEQEYWALSSQILAGHPMEVGRRTILFPLILAGLRRVWDNLWFVQCCVAVGAAGAAPLLSVVVKKMTGSELPALIAGVAFALWPTQIFFGSSLYSETLALPVFLLSLALLPSGFDGTPSSRWWQWILAGAMLGIAAHIRPMYQLFVPVLALIALLDSRRVAAAAARFGLIIAGFALVVLPWSIYVSRELGSPVLLSANGGETLAGGFNPKVASLTERTVALPTRTTWYGPGKWIAAGDTGYLTKDELSLPYVAQDRLLRERTVAWMTQEPASAAYLALRKLTYMWGIYPLGTNGWRQLLLGNIPLILLTLAFAWTLVRMPSVRRRCSRLYLLPLFVTGVGLISWGSWRFRLPGDAGLIAIVAIWAAAMINARRQAPEHSNYQLER